MDIREILENYNPWWFGEKIKEGITRDDYLKKMEEELKARRISFLIGLRRVGKTTLLKQFISKLINKGFEERKILYLSLDHPLIQKADLGEIIKEFRKLNEISRREKIYLFLDEVLHGKEIFQWLKVLYDNERVKIYATSSSSLRLKDEKALLTGRSKSIIIKPLSFREYLSFRGKKTNEPHLLERYFEEYLKEGGMPEYVLNKDVDYLIDLANSIITKDIVLNNRGVNIMKVKELFLLLLSRLGKPITYSKLSRVLGIKEETVESYINHLTNSELINVIYKWSKSSNEKIYSPKKIYLGDIGFRYALTGKYSIGSNFENLVYLKISDKEPSYYLEKGIEIDFITGKEVYECKFGRELSKEQEELLNKFRRRGYSINIAKDFRFFI